MDTVRLPKCKHDIFVRIGGERYTPDILKGQKSASIFRLPRVFRIHTIDVIDDRPSSKLLKWQRDDMRSMLQKRIDEDTTLKCIDPCEKMSRDYSISKYGTYEELYFNGYPNFDINEQKNELKKDDQGKWIAIIHIK